jgi:hypothetical protein
MNALVSAEGRWEQTKLRKDSLLCLLPETKSVLYRLVKKKEKRKEVPACTGQDTYSCGQTSMLSVHERKRKRM